MAEWEIEATPEFARWFGALKQDIKLEVAAKLALLRDVGPTLGRPHADTLRASSYPNLKEPRVKRTQIRIFFAFDPRRVGILLLGGSRIGDERFYEEMIPRAEALYARHLKQMTE